MTHPSHLKSRYQNIHKKVPFESHFNPNDTSLSHSVGRASDTVLTTLFPTNAELLKAAAAAAAATIKSNHHFARSVADERKYAGENFSV